MDKPPVPTSMPVSPARLRSSPWTDRLRRVMVAGLLLAGVVVALCTGLWVWSGSEGSLSSALRLTAGLLPSGYTLQAEGVRGNLRQGGHIEQLQWQQDGLALHLHQVGLQLDARQLLQGLLPVHAVQVDSLDGSIRPTTISSPAMTQLVWPLSVKLDWRVNTLRWEAPAASEATGLQGHYGFDGQQHTLRLDRLQWAAGRYQGQLTLQARAPMALDARLAGELRLPTAKAQMLQAQAQAQGSLSGTEAGLSLSARIGAAEQGLFAPQLQLQAQLRPHTDPVLHTLDARMQQIDLATLWPGAPHTQLDGTLQARPASDGWQLQMQLDNTLTGPWDQQRVPLQQMRSRLVYTPSGWTVQALQARWPGGGAQGSGQWLPTGTHGQWDIDRLEPGQWLSRLGGPALSGRVQLERSQSGTLNLQARLSPPRSLGTADGPASGMELQARLQEDIWHLDRLDARWTGTWLQATGQWSPDTRQVQGRLQGQLPGLNALLEGKLSPHEGQGRWHIEGHDTAQFWAWLKGWTVLPTALKPMFASATLQADGQWQGGWADTGLQLQSSVSTPDLRLQTRTSLAQAAPSGAMAGWKGQVQQMQLDWSVAAAQGQNVQLALLTPLDWQWQTGASVLRWQVHRWSLQGPGGKAPVTVQAGDWQRPQQASAWPISHLRATVSDLPARWSTWLGGPELQGNLLLDGGLNLSIGPRLQLQAWLERQTGDLQMAAERPLQARLQAGLRSARARWLIEGDSMQLELGWDSMQAGMLDAHLSSRLNLAATDLGGLWPATAPLSGQVRARLPRVGAWSWLAPPGWRVQGTLDAQAKVSGTRDQPHWSGLLQADDLAVRSAVEGVEFGQGRLRARLQGQQLVLEEFRLLGAGQQGGEVQATGQLRWLPQAGQGLEAVQVDLQTQARGLRVTRRADRRLSVSGTVRAQLDRGQLQLRGRLLADSALFILTNDSTPTLGKDVRIIHAPSGEVEPPRVQGVSFVGTPDVQVQLDLGSDFQLRGQGITTRLAGQVQLSSDASTAGQPRLVGQVRAEGGRYRAYGQQLDIAQGLLRFSGPYDNPALDILALRPNLPQPVGVRVTGSATAPRIRLYAEPDMPDADKLAWLVLGRSPAAGGAESAVLQQAALALLGGSGKGLGGELASALGIDDISVASRTTTTATGTTATGTALTLGKRLSRDFYLAYESSISGAFGHLYIFYDLSRKLTLRAQTGELNALDMIYTVRHD